MTSQHLRIGVISDTHGLLSPEVFDLFEGVELILHGGDVGGDHLLTELEAVAPVQAVTGNMDGAPHPARRPLTRTLETGAGRIAMTHGHLPEAPSTNLKRMKSYFEAFAPQIIVFGHSHLPSLEEIDGVWIFNPGSAGHPRFGRPPSVGLISRGADGELTLEHKALTQSAGL